MAKKFTRRTGGLFLLLGIIGLFTDHLGEFVHFEGMHNAIHLLFGFWALIAVSKEESALRYARSVGVFYIVMACLGIFSPAMFGLMHMELSANVFHFILGAWGLYVGFVQQGIPSPKVSEPI